MINKVVRHVKNGTLLSTISKKTKNKLGYKEPRKPYQLKRDNKARFNIIKGVLQGKQVNSILDVGCNAGVITRLAGEEGYFAVGIDKKLDISSIENPMKNACLGEIKINTALVNKLPCFDAILLLSVHHQIVKTLGDEYAKEFISHLAKKGKKVFVIEFAALNSKYGSLDGELFIDNDEGSIVNYAESWLNEALPNHKCEYISKTPPHGGSKEPYRFLFSCWQE